VSPRSIQRAAVWILENYYHDFPVYNPALLNLPKSVLSKKMSGFKVYSLGEGELPLPSASPPVLSPPALPRPGVFLPGGSSLLRSAERDRRSVPWGRGASGSPPTRL